MRFLRVLSHRVRSMFRRSHVELELQRELGLHIEQLTKEYIAEGMSARDAFAAARREFGSVSAIEEQCRDKRRVNFFEDLTRDLVYGLRALKSSPAFTATALLSLALGIGANTAIYSFMDAILIRTLPVRDSQSLVLFNWRAKDWPKVVHSEHDSGESYRTPAGGTVAGVFPYPFFDQDPKRNDLFVSVFGFAGAGTLNLIATNQAFLAAGEYVSGNYFDGLGTLPAAGRLIGEADDRPNSNPIAVISYRLAGERFGQPQKAVGRSILINRKPFTIAGVTPPDFFGVSPRDFPDLYLPIHTVTALDPRATHADWFHEGTTYWVEIMARLRPGVKLHQAEAILATRFHAFVSASATKPSERQNLPQFWLQEGASGIDSLRRQYSQSLYVLFAMTTLILAIACCNIANLLLSRCANRRREFAVRLSIGAGRWRLIRQLLTESLLLALLGAILAIPFAACGIQALNWLLANHELRTGLNVRVLLFAAGAAIVTGLVFGLAPASQAIRVDVTPSLKESRTSSPRTRRLGLLFGLSHVLVAGQIALSLILVVASGLFVRTLMKLHSISVGFNAEHLLVFNLDASQAGYDQNKSALFYENLRERLTAVPGVRAASMSDMPLVADSAGSEGIVVPGMPAPKDHPLSTNVTVVGPAFFQTMQIPLLLGRPIDQRDTPSSLHAVVVNEAFANKFFPHRNPIGQHFAFNEEQPVQIEGVVKNALYSSLKQGTPPVAYVPWSQWQGLLGGGMHFEVRTQGDPLALGNTVRKIVRDLDPRIPVAEISTQIRYIEQTISSERTFADLCTGFGFLALLIAAVGIYGTMTYAVSRRTNELGIRMALGAQRHSVIWMVQSEVLKLALAGLLIGLFAAWELSRFVVSLLFGIRATDPFTFGLSALILAVCAVAAGYGPALRAAHIDPVIALRNE